MLSGEGEGSLHVFHSAFLENLENKMAPYLAYVPLSFQIPAIHILS